MRFLLILFEAVSLLSYTLPTNGQCTGTLSGSTSVDDFTVVITMDCTNEKIQFDITYDNYNNDWFGLVFHHSMTPHPSLIYTTGKASEQSRSAALYYYNLQSKSPNNIIYENSNDWQEISNENFNGQVRVIYEQYLSNTEWDTSSTNIGFRFAKGSSMELAMHIYKSEHATVTLSSDSDIGSVTPTPTANSGSDNGTPKPTLSLTPLPTLFPTLSPTDMVQDIGDCGGNNQWMASGIFDYFTIKITIKCATETVEIEMTYTDFDLNWFGIVFSDAMLGDSLLYTSGKANDKDPKLYFYSITSGKSANSVTHNAALNWNEIETSVNGSRVTVIYEQDLSNTDWDFDTNEIPIRWAVGSSGSMRLSHHNRRSSNTKHYNFVSGGSRNEKDDLSMHIAHGCIMWICWCVFASFGILSSAFRWLFPAKPAGLWFKAHRFVQSMVLLLHLIGFVIAVILVQDAGIGHFSKNHHIMGLAVTALVILQPINAFCRPHAVKEGQRKPMTRLVWEIMHKSFGYSAWILACVTAYLGFNLPNINEPLLGYVHLFGWCLLLFMVYVVLTMVGCSMNKKQKHVRTVVSDRGSDDGFSGTESDQLVGGGSDRHL